MKNTLNYTTRFFRRDDRVWGGKTENGTFSGMVGDVHDGRFDVLGSSLTVRPSRADGVTYLPPIAVETYGLFVPAFERHVFRIFFYYIIYKKRIFIFAVRLWHGVSFSSPSPLTPGWD